MNNQRSQRSQRSQRRSSMMVRLVAVLAVTMMFTMCFVGGTFAKYTSSATGTNSTTVAKWDIKVNDTNITTSDNFTFDLFNTVKDTNGNPETDMYPNNGDIIAPGTRGSFDIVIKNDSQVNATYAIDYTVTNSADIPVKFSVDGINWFDDINSLDVRSVAINMGDTATVKVRWMWEFERTGGDATDTSLGSAATATLTVAANVTATQID